MREAVMSASLLAAPDSEHIPEREHMRLDSGAARPGAWSPENFAREQVHGLVRQVFFSDDARPVRQVVFSAVERETEVRSLCRRVGEALARETIDSVAVLGGCGRGLQDVDQHFANEPRDSAGTMALHRIATRVRSNLWLVPAAERDSETATTSSLHSYLGELRREFEYSVVESPPAGESNEATAMAQFADGIILVLSAHHTRRATARKIKDAIDGARARLLGTVLIDRVFPIPAGIYRKL